MIKKTELVEKLQAMRNQYPPFSQFREPLAKLIQWAEQLPDDQPQEPCIPVSVIRERIKYTSENVWDFHESFLEGVRDSCQSLSKWLDEQVQPTTPQPQPEPGDGWAQHPEDPEIFFRTTTKGTRLQIDGTAYYWRVYLMAHKTSTCVGIKPTLDSAKALANEFAEANGGWA